jgi:RNA polymerase sigma-70 factor, ECF subfamily
MDHMPVEAQAAELIDPIQALIREGGHRDALVACARQHGAAIGRVCMALLGVQSEAEEVQQETLLAAFQGMAAFRGEGTVRAWLFGIARRLCARRLETRVQQERKLRLVHDSSSTEKLADAEIERRQRAERMRRLLGELKPSEREVLLLHYEAELSFRDIGGALGIDEAAARKRASRGLARLRELMAGEE